MSKMKEIDIMCQNNHENAIIGALDMLEFSVDTLIDFYNLGFNNVPYDMVLIESIKRIYKTYTEIQIDLWGRT